MLGTGKERSSLGLNQTVTGGRRDEDENENVSERQTSGTQTGFREDERPGGPRLALVQRGYRAGGYRTIYGGPCAGTYMRNYVDDRIAI